MNYNQILNDIVLWILAAFSVAGVLVISLILAIKAGRNKRLRMKDDCMADNSCPQNSLFRPLIGIVYLLGTFAVFYLVLAGKTDIQWKDVALMVIGALITKSGTIVDWAFGSSQGSEQKTTIIAEQDKAKNQEPKG